MEIIYREIHLNELDDNILKHFNRYQNVLKDWCYENGEYVLKSSPHIENWDESAKKRKIKIFYTILQHGGKLFGAFDNNKLIGFSGVDGILVGSRKQYIELSELHVSYEYRGKKIGKELFKRCVESASAYNCKKLYIVASSSEESQKAYYKLGCKYAEELIPELYENSPTDVHMEYIILQQ